MEEHIFKAPRQWLAQKGTQDMLVVPGVAVVNSTVLGQEGIHNNSGSVAEARSMPALTAI